MLVSAGHRFGSSLRRRGAIAAGLAAVAGVFTIATAIPAWAHRPLVSGHAVCSDGDHTITWSIGNSDTNLTMHIASATATLGTQMFAVTGFTDVVANAETSATTIVPGGLTGDVVLSVEATWPDGFHAATSTSVPLVTACSPSTSTSTTSTTTRPTTTTEPAPRPRS